MKVSRTGSGATNRNTAVVRHVKIRFQRYARARPGATPTGASPTGRAVRAQGQRGAGGHGVDGDRRAPSRPSCPLGVDRKCVLEIFSGSFTLNALGAIEAKTTVKGVQRRLTQLGYDLGGIDGIIGRMTDGALLQFQADHNPLDPTGANDAATQN